MTMADRIERAKLYRADAVEIKERMLTSMRQVIKELRHVDADNQREKKAKCTNLLREAANNLTELFDLVLEVDDERQNVADELKEREQDDPHLERLMQMIWDMERGVFEPAEIATYAKEHWDEP